MTEQTQPTDAEILDAADDFRSQYKHGGTTFDEFDALDFARAVLARWGQPAHSGEPVAWLDPWTGTNVTADPDAYGKHGIPLVRQQPVVRELLTDEQIDQAIAELGLNYLADAHATNRAVLRKLCHHAHGIKGGQHDF